MSGHQGHAECGIAYERNATLRPGWHFDLADAVEMEVLCSVQLGKNALTFPLSAAKRRTQHRFLRGQIQFFRSRVNVCGKNKQKQRPIVVQCNAPEHSAWLAIRHIDILVARSVSAGLKHRNDVAEPLLKPILGPEKEAADV